METEAELREQVTALWREVVRLNGHLGTAMGMLIGLQGQLDGPSEESVTDFLNEVRKDAEDAKKKREAAEADRHNRRMAGHSQAEGLTL